MKPGGKDHPVDRVLHDGDTVALGGMTLTAHLTPGHTRGCTTWTMTVQDNGRPRNVVIVCGGLPEGTRLVNVKNYPEIADDYARAIKTYRTLNGEVFLGAHSWFFDFLGKRRSSRPARRPARASSAGPRRGSMTSKNEDNC
jgi:metallo-beta-lactamase class B